MIKVFIILPHFTSHPVDPVGILKMSVITQFVLDIESDYNENCHSYGQPKNVDK